MPSKPSWVALCLVALTSACASPSRAFTAPTFEACGPSSEHRASLRVVSFNIRSGLSSSIEAVGDVLADMDADIIAIQEVDVGTARTHRRDQPQALAGRLGMKRIFAAAIHRDGGDYGVALLSRLPITRASRIELAERGAFEPRVAIDATVCLNGQEVRVINVHADVIPWAGAANARRLGRLLREGPKGATIVAGDFNATPGEAAITEFSGDGLVDLLKSRAEGRTFLGSDRRLDYILADRDFDLSVTNAGKLEVEVSDHIPVWVDFGPRPR